MPIMAAQHVGIMVNNRVSVLVEHSCQRGLSHSHANCHAHALRPEACGGLNAYRMAIPGCPGVRESI